MLLNSRAPMGSIPGTTPPQGGGNKQERKTEQNFDLHKESTEDE